MIYSSTTLSELLVMLDSVNPHLAAAIRDRVESLEDDAAELDRLQSLGVGSAEDVQALSDENYGLAEKATAWMEVVQRLMTVELHGFDAVWDELREHWESQK